MGKQMKKIVFNKARQGRVFQNVVEQFEEALLIGKIKPGEVLPPEHILREMFGVSRFTLREALRVLEEKGLVEVRGGTGGVLVKNASTDQISENLAFLIRHRRISLEHLAEFREGVEMLVTGMAAERSEPGEIKVLRDHLKQAADCVEEGISRWKDFIRIDETIHMFIAKMTNNPIFTMILKTIHNNIHEYYDRFLPGGIMEMRENYEDLLHIVEAVEAHDRQRASDIAADHVRRFNKRMRKKQKQATIRKKGG